MCKPDVTGYLSSVSLAERLLRKGLIGRKEFMAFENKMLERYGLAKDSIYRNNRLLCVRVRANIAHTRR